MKNPLGKLKKSIIYLLKSPAILMPIALNFFAKPAEATSAQDNGNGCDITQFTRNTLAKGSYITMQQYHETSKCSPLDHPHHSLLPTGASIKISSLTPASPALKYGHPSAYPHQVSAVKGFFAQGTGTHLDLRLSTCKDAVCPPPGFTDWRFYQSSLDTPAPTTTIDVSPEELREEINSILSRKTEL